MMLFNKKINHEAVMKMPVGCSFGNIYSIKDMDDMNREAVLVMFPDRGSLRKSYFCIHTGDYLGEAF